MMRILLAALLVIILVPVVHAADLQFPKLSGRVVDEAGLLDDSSKAALETKLAEYENGTTNQVVIVTLKSLQGREIEEYGYQLGRHWGIGQKDKNNGVLFIVAPNERAVRIEVGYGLEGILTDANSSLIINQIVLPQFKQQNYQQGILDGTNAILSVLGGESLAVTEQVQGVDIGAIVFIILMIILFIMRSRSVHLPIGHSGDWVSRSSGWSSRDSGGWSSGGSSGGGFSGGGGSFGGGGASGRW